MRNAWKEEYFIWSGIETIVDKKPIRTAGHTSSGLLKPMLPLKVMMKRI